jgi:hypothetical protein
LDGNEIQTGGNTYTLSNVTAGHTVHVTFKTQTFTVTATAGENGNLYREKEPDFLPALPRKEIKHDEPNK